VARRALRPFSAKTYAQAKERRKKQQQKKKKKKSDEKAEESPWSLRSPVCSALRSLWRHVEGIRRKHKVR
jgi:hypothetical protein